MSDEPSTARAGRSRKRFVWVGAGVLLVAAAAATIVVIGSDTDSDADCWGAWGGLESPWAGGEVEVSEARPSAADPRGSCEVVVTLAEDDETWQHTLEVSYGPLPADQDELVTWIEEHLRGDVAPLPVGLSGGVTSEHGLLVLPERCAIDGGPAVVTMTTRYSEASLGRGDADHGSRPAGSPSHLAELLVGVARQGMSDAGCAADEDPAGEDDEAAALPTEVAPIQRVPLGSYGEGHLCGHPELPTAGQEVNLLGSRRYADFHAWTPAVGVGDGDIGCSLAERRPLFDTLTGELPAFGPPASATVLLATADPNQIRLLEAIADGLDARPLDGWDGTALHGGPLAVATVDCGTGEPEPTRTLFAAHVASDADWNPADLLADYQRAMAPSRDCEGVAPDA
ncbi:hypothetical protein RM844_28210 [Streptomyces sp. DSM 44915]|uniref:Secreted protein n=1 Tax=Streptomyces chisholmiae TaxID=3075540 RepID=A0ABU2JYT1_9ACTN|nr:hypothetical protein [Streptomyces sp. DSM 44915]MDT0270161.1 hypothetical protein [Streptomyces sp. DSM 44915]